MLIVLLAAPLGVRSLTMLSDWLLTRRAHQYMQQCLPAVSSQLVGEGLAAGQVRLLTLSAHSMLIDHFAANKPAALENCLELQRLQLTTRPVAYDPDHWQAARQQLYRPLVIMTAGLTLSDGKIITLVHAIEILLD